MATLTLNNLIDEQTGEVDLSVLKALARRRAMQDYGEFQHLLDGSS